MLEMVAPRDAAVLRRVVSAILHYVSHRAVEIRNQAALERNAGDGREHALRHAVGRIGTQRIAELGDDVAARMMRPALPPRSVGIDASSLPMLIS